MHQAGLDGARRNLKRNGNLGDREPIVIVKRYCRALRGRQLGEGPDKAGAVRLGRVRRVIRFMGQTNLNLAVRHQPPDPPPGLPGDDAIGPGGKQPFILQGFQALQNFDPGGLDRLLGQIPITQQPPGMANETAMVPPAPAR